MFHQRPRFAAISLLLISLLPALDSQPAEPVIHDWRIGEIANVSRHGDGDASLTVYSGSLYVSISTYLTHNCDVRPSTLIRFRVRSATWWSNGDNVVQFYPAQGESCFGLQKKLKVNAADGKERKVVIWEARASYVSEDTTMLELQKERQMERERWWRQNAIDRGVPGDPAHKGQDSQ